MAKVSDQSAAEPTLSQQAAWEEVVAGLRGCIDDQGEKIKVLSAALDQSQQINQALAVHLDDVREREREVQKELIRLRALRADAKAVVLYLASAVDETLAGSESRFARDAVAEAGARILEALADD